MPFVVFETRWKKALSSILEELTAPEFKKLLFRLDKIPQGQKAEIPREALPDQIVKSYGPEGSILAIEKEMKVLPRNDARVQELLRPFVDKVREQKKLQQETRGEAVEMLLFILTENIKHISHLQETVLHSPHTGLSQKIRIL